MDGKNNEMMIKEQFLRKEIFNDRRDPFWNNCALKFILSCDVNIFQTKTIEELLKCLCDTDFAKQEENFKKYNVKEIDDVYNLNDNAKVSIFEIIKTKIGKYLEAEKQGDINANAINENVEDIADSTNETTKNNSQDIFGNLPYDYYLKYGPTIKNRIKHFKISPKCLAMLTDSGKKLYMIEDEKIAKNIFKQFLIFVKKAEKEKGYDGVKGVVYSACWARKIKYLFKKMPEAGAAARFFFDKFEENNIKVDSQIFPRIK